MVEIAICLAIIGIALVAIIGVLPIGIGVQKDNRQETLVNQDAAVLLENIRNGARGMDGLTNYVFAITNSWTEYVNGTIKATGVNGYSYAAATVNGFSVPVMALTNGANIIGLLSTPEYTDLNNGAPISSLINGGISNHVVAWVHSISGPAVEKAPQTNDVIRSDSFSYKVLFNNSSPAVDTPPLWRNQQYGAGAYVTYIQNGQVTYWRSTARTSGQPPGGRGSPWAQVPRFYPAELQANSHELRLTFLWPLLPNGSTGSGRHTFATTVAGQVVQTNIDGYALYFFQPQSFTAVP